VSDQLFKDGETLYFIMGPNCELLAITKEMAESLCKLKTCGSAVVSSVDADKNTITFSTPIPTDVVRSFRRKAKNWQRPFRHYDPA